MVTATPRPLYTQDRDPLPVVQEAGLASGSVWTGTKNLSPAALRTSDRPAPSKSLYHLHCRGNVIIYKDNCYYKRLQDIWPIIENGVRFQTGRYGICSEVALEYVLPRVLRFPLVIFIPPRYQSILFICNRCCVTLLIDRVVKHPVSCFRPNRENGMLGINLNCAVLYILKETKDKNVVRETKNKQTKSLWMNGWMSEWMKEGRKVGRKKGWKW